MHSFFWLYLTINASDFHLIPIDRSTNIGGIHNTLHIHTDVSNRRKSFIGLYLKKCVLGTYWILFAIGSREH